MVGTGRLASNDDSKQHDGKQKKKRKKTAVPVFYMQAMLARRVTPLYTLWVLYWILYRGTV